MHISIFYISAVGSDSSVDLRNESLANLKIGQEIKSEHQFVKKYDVKEEGTVVLSEKGKIDPNLLVTVDKKKSIVALTSEGKKYTTSKGIQVKDTFQNVVKTYGEDYKDLWFVEGYESGIQYQDKQNDLLLEFYFIDNKVALIKLEES
ncbi:hypothetical protein HOO54_05735 [Bacillus sp. WMMC1349]|uniref:hypothetical protein n=1 Tax=Bacillus sp. WMMC1349 TaxID=2736254 RepID=UPI0015529DB3|nr:hypothetical protein [Bacillus sp. WMMC1349]NPC91746.1 hypothetical protein [Bacillus sp. WMMC1349]